MKKFLYPLLILSTFVIAAFILFAGIRKENTVPTFIERSGTSANSSEWTTSKSAMLGLLDKIRRNPKDNQAKLNLALMYIQESRISGAHAHYDAAAIKLTDMILTENPQNFEALSAKATVLLSQHHFQEAADIATKALPLNAYNAGIYGILCDANVELGNYSKAIEMADKMTQIRPDIRSYSRIAYLREIMGDYLGAKEAMRLAVSSGYPGMEQTEWCRVQLGHLLEITQDTNDAHIQYQTALMYRKDYPFALAGLGRLAKIKGDYPAAIQYFEKANTQIEEFSFYDELTDLYLLNNQKEKSAATAKKVLEMLGANTPQNENTPHGHYTDRELAYAYLKINDSQNALKHALIEYHRRPNNIDVNETLGWAYYNAKNYTEAKKYIKVALSTNAKNPVLLQRAALVFAK